MKILIVKMSALGDVVHALPILDYLHQAVPGAEVDWLVEAPFRDVLEGNRLIRRLHVSRTKVWRKKPFSADTRREFVALRNALREEKYDIVFDIQGNMKSGVAGWLTGAEKRLGFTKDFLQESANSLFTTRQIPMRREDQHVTDQYLRLVSVPFGRDFRQMRLHTDIFTTAEDDLAAEALLATLSDGLVFLFQYGTTWQTKFWSEKNWIGTGKAVLAAFPESTILYPWGNEAEREIVTRLARETGEGARVLPKYSLKGIAALLKKVDAVVGGDTGIVHMAAAVGTPTVSFYRASDGRRSGPRGAGDVIIQSPFSCSRCFRTRCDDNEKCQESITIEAVLDGLRQILT